MKNTIQDKSKLVNYVFTKVHKKYDVMNDIMSLGSHRIWKERLIEWMSPQLNQSLVDVAAGTGDIAKIFTKKTRNSGKIFCVEPNREMYLLGKNNLRNFKNIEFYKSSAENLPFKNDSFDFYTISFGIRNVSNINQAIKEAHRVLKPGGRFLCLEFSKIDNELINVIYQQYSKVIPFLGKLIVGSSKPYDYLIKSIDEFYSQDELVNLIKENGFNYVEYRNLYNGIAAIHSGWKI